MEIVSLFEKEKQDNTLPYFVEIQRTNDKKKMRIPCSNETVAKRVLASYSNYKSNGKVPLVRNWNFKIS